MMEIYRKNSYVKSKEQAEELLAAMDDFVFKPVIGRAMPGLEPGLARIWNNGKHLEWSWEEETEQAYKRRLKQEEKQTEELKKLKSDLEYFKDMKIRPWRNQKLSEWIDATFLKPLQYKLSAKQIEERKKLRQKLLDWPALFETYKTEAEIEESRPAPPTWISGQTP